VVELTYPVLNPKSDMSVVFTINYSFSGMLRLVDSETILVTDFVNLNIKLTQSFEDFHRVRMYVHIFIGVNTYTSMSIIFILYF
jgi:hypothetical protein